VSGLRSLLRLSGAPLHGPAASSYPNGQTVAYDYYPNVAATTGTGNGDQRLKQIANSRSGSLYSRFDYGYKVDGAINSWTKTLGPANPVEMAFSYDPIDRLTGATYKDGAAVLAQYGYTYDKGDNRTTERRNEILSTASFNNVNELTALSGGGVVGFTGTTTEEAAVTVGGQVAQTSQVGTRFEKAVTLPVGTNTVTIAAVDPSGNTNSKNYRVVVSGGAVQSFTYDANGNMTSDGVRSYAWDAENRLIKITEGTKTTDIEYDGFHHWTRIHERNGSTTVSDRRFIWDGNTMVEQRNGTSTTAAQRYLPQGVQQGTNKFFYTRDHLGSIREVANNSGSVVARYDYDPYGRRTKLSGTFDSDFGFTGHYFHAPSGLHFAPFRAYSADLGRWLSRDPIGEEGGINLYGYVGNNPLNWIDPLGLITVVIPGAGPQDKGSNKAFKDRVDEMECDTRHFGRHQRDQDRALDAIREALAKNPSEEINIYGYSRGGVGALELAEKLNRAGIPVDNLILVDPVTVTGNRGGLNVPSNVKNAESHYQRGKRDGPLDFPGTPINQGRNLGYPHIPHQEMPLNFERL